MRVMYLNGERVYVEKINDLDPRREEKWSCFDGKMQIVKHEDIVRALNCVFQYAEEHPDVIGDDLGDIIRNLNFHSREANHKIHVELFDPKTTWFDDSRKIKLKQRTKQEKLNQEEVLTGCRKPEVIHGGLYKPPEDRIHGGILSDTGKAFAEKLQNPTQPGSA